MICGKHIRITFFTLIVALTCDLGNAAADTVYLLDNPSLTNGDLNTYSALTNNAFGKATVHWTDATHATVTFTTDGYFGTKSGDTYAFLFGAGSGLAVVAQVNATTWTTTSLGGSNRYMPGVSGFLFASSQLTESHGGSNSEDGFGTFNQYVNTSSTSPPYTYSATTISFNLTNTGGTWADDAHVLTANASHYFVAAHIFTAKIPVTVPRFGSDGFAAGDDGISGGANTLALETPEPASFALVGSAGLCGLFAYLRRRRELGAA
jgi:hypothetical protein